MTINPGWRDLRGNARNRNRRLKRNLLLVALISLLGLYLIALMAPLRHPNTHLVYAVAGGDPRQAVVPPPFALEQYAHLSPLKPTLYRERGQAGGLPLRTPAQIGSPGMATGLDFERVADSDAVLVYVAAHQILGDNGPAIRPSGLTGAVDELAVSHLLQRVRSLPGATKLLILDLTSPLTQADGLLLPSTFGQQVAELVVQTADPELWVLVSHSPLEQTHQSMALRRTVFGYFVARGLQGEADLDRDNVITITEILLYVRTTVSQWAEWLTDGHGSQTPQLHWGGGRPTRRDGDVPLLPVIAAMSGPGGAERDLEASIADAQASDPASRWQGVFEGGIANRMVPVSDQLREQLGKARIPPGGAVGASLQGAGTQAADGAAGGGPSTGSDAAAKTGAQSGQAAANAEPASAVGVGSGDEASGGRETGGGPATAPRSTASPVDAADSDGFPIDPAKQSDLLDRLALAWSIHDRLLERRGVNLRPIDYAPDLWWAYQTRLLAVDQAIRSGWTFDTRPLLRLLEEELLPMGQLVPSGKSDLGSESAASAVSSRSGSSPSLVQGFVERRPTFKTPRRVHSLALLIASDGFQQRFDQAVRKQLARYPGLIRDGGYEEFSKWYEEALPLGIETFAEWRPLVHFPGLSQADWPLYRRWLQVVWEGERAAVAVSTKRPWQNDLLAADRARRAGEREFIDRIRADWRSAAEDRFADALRRYDGVLAVVEQTNRIDTLTNELLAAMPYCFAMHVQGLEHPEQPFPTTQEIAELFEVLTDARRIRLDPRPAFGDLRGTADGLARVRARFIHFAEDTEVERLISGPIRLSDAWFLRSLLNTPLIPAASRMRLISVASEIEIAGLRSQPLPEVVEAAQRSLRGLRPDDLLEDPDGMARAAVLAEFARGWVRWQLAAFSLADFGVAPEETLVPQERSEAWGKWLTEAHPADQFLSAYDELRQAVSVERDRFPTRLEMLLDQAFDLRDIDQRDRRLSSLDRIIAWGRLFGAPIGPPFDAPKVAARAGASRRFLQLAWLAARDRLAAAEASPEELPGLLTAIRDHQELAGAEPLEPSLTPVAGSTIAISGPDRYPLGPEQTEGEVPFVVVNRGATETEVWLVFDSDPDLLEVEAEGLEHAYLESDLKERLDALVVAAEDQRLVRLRGDTSDGGDSAAEGENAAAAQAIPSEAARALGFGPKAEAPDQRERYRRAAVYPYRPDQAGLPPTLRLNAGESRTVVGRLRRKDGFGRQTKVILRGISVGGQTRHDTTILLPNRSSFEVLVSGAAASRVEDLDSGERLLPYPNRITSYQVALRNRREDDFKAIVSLLTPLGPVRGDPPDTMVSAAAAKQWLDQLGGTAELVAPQEMVLLADGTPLTILPPPPKKPEADADSAAAPPAAPPSAAGDEADETADETAAPPGISVTHGLILVVQDPAAETVGLRLIRISSQRPRRYVLASAAYDLTAGKLNLRIEARDPAVLPEAGVPIVARVGDDAPRPLDVTLSGRLDPAKPSLVLTADVAPDEGRLVTTELDVDGFPRAFLFRFFPNATQPNVPEWVERSRLKILTPAGGTAFRSPLETIALTAQVDVPVGTFLDPRDELLIGVDANRDRVFRDEEPLRLGSDRQVDIRWLNDPKATSFDLLALVEDFQLDVPAGRLRDTRVNLLAQLRAEGRDSWSDPVEVILDGQPPRVGAVRIMPGRVAVLGQPLEVSLNVDDDLSGVLSVRCGFAKPGTEQFADKPPPVDAGLTGGGTWAASVPTEGLVRGSYRLLLQATDRVGNASRPEAVLIELRSEAEMEAERNQPKSVAGVVVHGSTPVAGATVELFPPEADPPPAALASRITDSQGRFQFDRVSPGDYRLSARGLVRNVRRRQEQNVTVPQGNRPLPTVRLVLQ